MSKVGLSYWPTNLEPFLCFQLDFQLKTPGSGGDLGSYVTNGEWDLLGNVTQYES